MTAGLMLVTTGDRASRARATLEAFGARFGSQFTYYVFCQDYSAHDQRMLELALRTNRVKYEIAHRPMLLGPYIARHMALTAWGCNHEQWVNLDDDMLPLGEQTNYDKPLARVLEPGVGIVGCNWVKTTHPAIMARAKVADRFVRQHIVYTGGGYVYGPAVRDLIMASEPRPYLFDNLQWSLTAYLAGLENYRYLGSLAHHAVAGPGGRHRWTHAGNASNRIAPDPRYVTATPVADSIRDRVGGDLFRMPAAGDLTPLAHELHEAARKAAGWPSR